LIACRDDEARRCKRIQARCEIVGAESNVTLSGNAHEADGGFAHNPPIADFPITPKWRKPEAHAMPAAGSRQSRKF
jgi:hypothetical protein